MLAGGVPVLETERLLLRAILPDDLAPHAAAVADPAVVRYIGGTPLSREEAWRKLSAAHAMWSLLGYGYWAVARKQDGAYLGITGFADFKRSMTPSIEGLPEMGWVFAPHAHGKGYASEAVAAGLEWADEALQGQEITAIIDPGNTPSIRVAEKAGFTVREDADYGTKPILLFRRPSKG